MAKDKFKIYIGAEVVVPTNEWDVKGTRVR